MKSFRLRFAILGLLVCMVSGQNCGTQYDDAASNAFLSDVVVVGKVSQKLPLGYQKYNATIRIRGSRNVFKGKDLLKKGSGRRRSQDMITVGVFQDLQENGAPVPGDGECAYTLTRDIEYIFFLNSTSQARKYFFVTAVPIAEHLKREFKRAKKEIKKILCKSGNCGVTPPILDPRRGMKDASVQFGKKLELNCKLKKRTFPVSKFVWFKNGVDVTHKNEKGFSVKDNKKGSVLRIRRVGLSDNGTYVCVARNVVGELRQQAVITVSGVNAPQLGSTTMKNKQQKFRGTLKLTCKIKRKVLPQAKFFWYKDGKLIESGYKKGLKIRSRGTQSKLRKKPFLQSDAGVYTCKAKNAYGEITQQSNVTVIDAPKRTEPCGERDKHWCMNNGTCMMYVELDQKYCTCAQGFKGKRCEEFTVDVVKKIREGEEKLAQDRNLVIVGIISGILLFIGICVASYFLAKRRREQFYRRRRQRHNGTIEDNIPQIYRPLIGCDDIDGLKKQMAGYTVPRSTQTMETCFVGNEKNNLHLYINPMTGYTNKNERKAAVSLDNNPRPTYNGSNESLDKHKHEHQESNSDNNNRSNPGSKRNSINNSASDGGPSEIFKLMNDLNPKKKSAGADKPANSGANKPNIPTSGSPGSTDPPAFNLDTDSEDEVLNDATPLTPLHISEEEDNNPDFPKIKHIKTNSANASNNQAKRANDPPRRNSSKDELKSKQIPQKQPVPQSQPRQQAPHPNQQSPVPKQRAPAPKQHQQPPPRYQQPPPPYPGGPDPRRQQPKQHHPNRQHSPSAQNPQNRPAHPSRHENPHRAQHTSRQDHPPTRDHPPRLDHPGRPDHPGRQDHQHRQDHPRQEHPRQEHPRQEHPPRQEHQPRQEHPLRQEPKQRQDQSPRQQNPQRQSNPHKQQQLNPKHHHHKNPESRKQRADNKAKKHSEARGAGDDKLYASTSSSGYTDSDSSTTTEGCDSPNTAFMNAQDLSEGTPALKAPVQEEGGETEDRGGSPEPRQIKASSKYKPPPDIGVGREQYYSASGAESPGRKGAGVRDYGRNFRQSR